MMFYSKLYCDEHTARRKNKVIRKLRRNAGQVHLFLITIAENDNLFEILHCANLKQPYFPKKDLKIVGLASNYNAAVNLVISMIHDFSSKYHTYHFKESLLLEEEQKWRSY